MFASLTHKSLISIIASHNAFCIMMFNLFYFIKSMPLTVLVYENVMNIIIISIIIFLQDSVSVSA